MAWASACARASPGGVATGGVAGAATGGGVGGAAAASGSAGGVDMHPLSARAQATGSSGPARLFRMRCGADPLAAELEQRIKAPMTLLLLEALGALVILLLIVWWTMFSGRPKGELPADTPPDGEEGLRQKNDK